MLGLLLCITIIIVLINKMPVHRSGWVRGPVSKAGYEHGSQSLFEHGFGNTESPELQPPMVLIDGELIPDIPIVKGETNPDVLNRLKVEREIGENAALAWGGVGWFIVMRALMGPVGSAVAVGGGAVAWGLSYLVSDADTTTRNLDDLVETQAQEIEKWSDETGITLAELYQYGMTDLQLAALEKDGPITLNKAWWKYKAGHTVNTEDVLVVERILEAKINKAKTPPNWFSPNAILSKKKDAYKLAYIPLIFVVLLILWRRRKKKRRG